jgi:hypothetical protein
MEKKTDAWKFFWRRWRVGRWLWHFEKMQTTIRIWATSLLYYIRLWKFISFNHISFFQYFYLGCGAPSKRVEQRGLVSLFFLVGLWSPWDIRLVSGFLHRLRQRAVELESNVFCRSVCCGELSELSGRMGNASSLWLRPQSRAEARLSELLFAAEWTNSSALRSPRYPHLYRSSDLCILPYARVLCDVKLLMATPQIHPHFNKLENVKKFRSCLHLPSLAKEEKKKEGTH